MTFLETLKKRELKNTLPEFAAGDRVRVDFRISEGGKERVQAFEGIVIRRKGGTTNASFTVRKIASGVGVERTFPVHSPLLEKVEVMTKGRVRRGRLYYLRDLRGKKARIQTLAFTSEKDLAAPGSADEAFQREEAEKAKTKDSGSDSNKA